MIEKLLDQSNNKKQKTSLFLTGLTIVKEEDDSHSIIQTTAHVISIPVSFAVLITVPHT